MMVVSGLAFALSIPVIALSHSYSALFAGRLLQGISGGFVGVVVPLYLAECLPASSRGRGTAVFQWLLTFGIFSAAVIGIYFSYRVKAYTAVADAVSLTHFKDHAWRSIFWASLPPGVLFVLGSLFVNESPRWLYRRHQTAKAETALLRSRMPDQAALELEEMRIASSAASTSSGTTIKDSLLRRKYVFPFLLACVILACNQATGINSIIGYNTNILIQSGLNDLAAHWGYVLFTAVNFLMTMGGVALVDRKGRKFLFIVGCTGLCASLFAVGILFHGTERSTADVTAQVQSLVKADQTLSLQFDQAAAATLLGGDSHGIQSTRASIAVIYAFGDFNGATNIHRSDEQGSAPIAIDRASALPGTKVEAFFQNPFADLHAAQTAPLRIVAAKITAVPDSSRGWIVAIALYLFMSFYAIGPGVCVWLALSELMPTRIRSNGMSVALLINQAVSTALAGVFLPVVSKHGYSFMFFLFAGCSLFYLLAVALFLPETKGKTLEEIEKHFEGSAS